MQIVKPHLMGLFMLGVCNICSNLTLDNAVARNISLPSASWSYITISIPWLQLFLLLGFQPQQAPVCVLPWLTNLLFQLLSYLFVALPPVLAHRDLPVISCSCRGSLMGISSVRCSASLWGVASFHYVRCTSDLYLAADLSVWCCAFIPTMFELGWEA